MSYTEIPVIDVDPQRMRHLSSPTLGKLQREIVPTFLLGHSVTTKRARIVSFDPIRRKPEVENISTTCISDNFWGGGEHPINGKN